MADTPTSPEEEFTADDREYLRLVAGLVATEPTEDIQRLDAMAANGKEAEYGPHAVKMCLAARGVYKAELAKRGVL